MRSDKAVSSVARSLGKLTDERPGQNSTAEPPLRHGEVKSLTKHSHRNGAGRHRAWAWPLAVGCGMALGAPGVQGATTCSVGGIEALGVDGVTAVSATAVPAFGTTPAYCGVVGQLNTSGGGAPPGSAGFEMQFPDNWNGKFLFFGVGGLAGATYPDISANPVDRQGALGKGYATAITDAGHLAGGTDASWALLAPGQPDEAKLADYYYRATHQVTAAGKQLTQGFYGQAVAAAYFDGCSNGGRQALVEATRFPDDYDGIIAGDPFFDIRSAIVAARLAKQQLSRAAYIPATLLPMVDAAVNASCTKTDGVDDGLIQNPAACAFDPRSLVCKPGQDADCLSTGQADTLSAYFTATRNTFGSLVYPGFSVSNLAGGADVWTTGRVPPADFDAAEPWGNAGFNPSPVGYQFGDHIIQHIVTQDPTLNIRDYPVSADGTIDDDTLATFDARTGAGTATVPESYRRFIQRGGKLIIYHGYSDPALTPFRTTALYDQLAAAHGGYSTLQASVRLFMVPGMQHCTGGPGPDVFDTLTPLDAWVQAGTAPDSIPAAHHDDPAQAADRTMPLCPYPTQATYDGAGFINAAGSWSCTPNQKLLQVGPNGAQAGLAGP